MTIVICDFCEGRIDGEPILVDNQEYCSQECIDDSNNNHGYYVTEKGIAYLKEYLSNREY